MSIKQPLKALCRKAPAMEYQKGSTLIETLIALFILATGLLGVLAMQAVSVNSNQRAQYSSELALLAGDIADSIYAYDDVDVATDNDDFDNIDTNDDVTMPDCSAGCDAAAERNLAVALWRDSVRGSLPSGRGMIDYNAATGIYTISLMWDSERTGATGTDCSGDPDVDLACFSVEAPLL